MNKSAIQKFAIQARRDLIAQVKQQAYNYGIDANGFGEENATTVNDVVIPIEKVEQRKALISVIKNEGYEKVMDRVAYTWFNRFIALRYMEVNDYLPTHIRVFTNDKGEFKPAILKDALSLDLKGLDKNKVIELLNNPTGEEDLYRYLLLTQCNALNEELPEMFEKLGSYEELLLPLKILSDESVIAHLVNDIEEDDFKEAVEIIGWLYQYYNTEPKAEVYEQLKKHVKISSENLPIATQLFTPDWIVRYMVENSLGRLWIEGHEDNVLKDNWKYYLDEAEQTESVQAELNKIKENYKNIKLEDIKIIDPCMGSGHILVYAFDVLVQIYESQGYSSRDSASLILENNLYGLDIDERAYQLAYFALMMKGRSYDRRFLTRGVKPQVYCPKGYEEGLEYGSLVQVEELEEKPTEPKEITFFDGNYEEKLNRWNFRRLLSQKYDVVVTNPPYMGSNNLNSKLADYIKKYYPDSKSDLFAVFIERGNELVKVNGFLAMITQPSVLFLSSFEKLREKLFINNTFSSLIHMGRGIFGIDFGSTAFVLRKGCLPAYQGCYFKLHERTFQYVEPDDIAKLYLLSKGDKEYRFNFSNYDTSIDIENINNEKNGMQLYFETTQESFSKIPGSPIAYWVSEKMLDAFENGEKFGEISPPKVGLQTGCNDIFLRQWFEPNFSRIGFGYKSCEEAVTSNMKWFPYNKGGDFRKWYGNDEYVVNWENNGLLIKNFKNEQGKLRSRPQNTQFYFKECFSWSLISSGAIAFRYKPNGYIFDVAGMSCFSDKNIKYFLALCNSKIAMKALEILAPTINYQAGDIAGIPAILSTNYTNEIEILTDLNIKISKTDWDAFETSWDFEKHPLINGTSIKTAFENWENDCNNRFNQLKANEEELNKIFIDIYGLQDELTPEVEDKDVTVRKANLEDDIKSFISYAVGCMFGRYSLDVDGLAYAGGDFDKSKYTTFIPDDDNIIPICDDEYFNDDIVNRFVEFVKVVYGENTLEENLDFIAKALKRKGDSSREIIRGYFLNDFYKDHLKTYQNRPIYWLFDSGKNNGFKALTYMHRYQKDLLAKVRTDYVHEQQERYSTQLENIRHSLLNASGSEKVKLTKRESKLKDQALEIQQYEEKIKHLADRQIEIDLDDGVKNNYALFGDVLAKI